MSARAWTAGLGGIVVGAGLSVLATVLLNLSEPGAFIVGVLLGGICTLAAVMWVER